MTAQLTREAFPDLLGPLDRVLRRAVKQMLATYGPGAAADPFRGLYVSHDDAARLLARWPGAQPYDGDGGDDHEPSTGYGNGIGPALPEWWRELASLTDDFRLSPFERDVILLALAPELDLRYERVFAFLQDDVSRRRPGVDLALNLLCPTAELKLRRRRHFTEEAPLIRHHLIALVPDPNSADPPLLAHALRLDERIVRRLLGQTCLDPLLIGACTLVGPGDLETYCSRGPLLPNGQQEALISQLRRIRSAGEALQLYVSGRSGATRYFAGALAAAAGAPLLTADLTRAVDGDTNFESLVVRMLDEARSFGAIPYVAPWETVLTPERTVERQLLMAALADFDGITILAGETPHLPRGSGAHGLMHVDLPVLGPAQRAICWRNSLAAADEAVDDTSVERLAGQFRFTGDQIDDAVALARNQVRRRVMTHSAPADGADTRAALEPEDLFRAARAQSDGALDGLARKIEPVHNWDQIVLPEDTLAQLHEMCQQVVHRHHVLDEWGFGRRLSVGKGVTALFAGPSGTGKTMAADVIAHGLGLDLYKIDLSGVVSKYIGETEKNLRHIFTAAENANAILFFDEADALFGKRSEVRDSHDRYANIEVAYLLQQMDQYDGVAILATNLRQNMDEAFVRRLCFAIDFPFPDEGQRTRIWRIHFPPEARRSPDLDFATLGAQLRITGGNIKNIVLSAAFLAASADQSIGADHLLHATRREFQKTGRVLPAELDLAGTGMGTHSQKEP